MTRKSSSDDPSTTQVLFGDWQTLAQTCFCMAKNDGFYIYKVLFKEKKKKKKTEKKNVLETIYDLQGPKYS